MNMQKWLTNKLKGDYIENDIIIEIVLFETLIRFVEYEKGLTALRVDWSEDLKKGHITEEVLEVRKKIEKDLLQAYNYIKKIRPNIIKILENVEDWRKYEEIEKKMIDKDTKTMNTIIKHRGYMWT